MKRGISAVFLLFCLGISAQQLSSFLPEGGKVTERNSSGKTWAMNGVYPMPLPEVLKKFDERLGLGSEFVCGEEVDFLLSNYEKNAIFYIPEVTVYHKKKNERTDYLYKRYKKILRSMMRKLRYIKQIGYELAHHLS